MKPKRSKRRKSATKKTAPSIRKWTVEEPEAILDYLHGYTRRGEAVPCCHYEYARTSTVFRRARQEYDSINAGDPVHRVMDKFPEFWNDWQTLDILICPGYPELPWRDLSEAQRKTIVENFVKTRPPSSIPIMTQSFILNKTGVFDSFKQQAMSDACEWKKRQVVHFIRLTRKRSGARVTSHWCALKCQTGNTAFRNWLRADSGPRESVQNRS